LVGTLSRHGHLERTPDSTDRRSVRLTLTLTAQDRVERWRDHRAILIASALDQLPPADRAAISQALGSLERLADALDGEVEGEIR
jgi:DNA-binding MarR family transcriptional regulator